MRSARALPLLGCWLALSPAPLAAQNRRCQLDLLNVDRALVTAQVTPATSNYFAGGNVRMKCRGQEVRVWADSVASYTDQVVQFIGSFRFEDEVTKVTSDFGTYYKADERWEATGNVVYLNRKDGSKLVGPNATYRRKIGGTRDLQEVYADQRPTLTVAIAGPAVQSPEPYLVVADRVRMRGEDLMWGGGSVTIDRSDLRGRGDSLELDTGKGSTGALIGHASIRRAAQDSFALAGKRIDLGLTRKELNLVTGRDSATLQSKDLNLSAAAIQIVLESGKVVQTFAWGKSPRPRAVADDYEVRGDSLAVDTPAEMLRELRAFQSAWVGFRPDSLQGERDYIEGDSVTASFESVAVAGSGPKAALRTLEARHLAKSFYRLAGAGNPAGAPSISYARADKILLTMQGGDSLKVQRVDMSGSVDGVQLQPEAARRDTTVRADSTRIKPRLR
jgi:hypothetical protein